MPLLRSLPRLEAIAQDVRYALRGLLSSKGFTATVTAAALLAAFLPSRRAARVDPALALRTD